MKYQDLIFSVGSMILSYSLIPQIVRIIKKKNADQFSWGFIIPTAIVLIVFCFAYASLGLKLTAGIGSITSICYCIIGFLKIKYGRIK